MLDLEIIETCFGSQVKNHVLLYGGRVRPKELEFVSSSKNELEEEKKMLKDWLKALEDAFKEFIQSRSQDQPSTSQSTQVIYNSLLLNLDMAFFGPNLVNINVGHSFLLWLTLSLSMTVLVSTS